MLFIINYQANDFYCIGCIAIKISCKIISLQNTLKGCLLFQAFLQSMMNKTAESLESHYWFFSNSKASQMGLPYVMHIWSERNFKIPLLDHRWHRWLLHVLSFLINLWRIWNAKKFWIDVLIWRHNMGPYFWRRPCVVLLTFAKNETLLNFSTALP